MKIQREYIGNYSYEVGINSVADYSPFGVELDGRTIQNIFHHPSQNNGSQTQADTVEIYNNDFDNPPATGSPYLSTEVTLDAHLSNTTWTSSTGAFTNYNSSRAGSGKSIAITTASADTAYLTLTMDVDSGYELDITSYSFAHRSSATGYNSYTLVVNGIEIGSGSIYVATSGSTLQSTGVVNVNNTVSGVTGTVNVVLKLYGGTHGYSGTFRMDDFVLNGFVQEESSGNSSSDYFVSNSYRYGFNNKEMDNEWQGQGNSYDYGFRIYNPRLGRFLSIDPLFRSYPFYSPYQFAGNMPIAAVDLDGLEIYFAANGNYIGKWGTSTEVRVINNDRVKEFQKSVNDAHSNPNDWIKQDIMDFYWRGSHGSRSPSTADKNAISRGHVIPTSTHESYSTHGDCYASACATLANNNYVPGDFWGEDAQYQFQMYKAGKTPNVDIEKTRLAGFEKINSELEAGKPILVGVDYVSGSSNPNTDNTTDHFIVLTGRGFDDDGNLFYTGFENVDGGSNSNGTSTSLNRFYVQSDGTLQGGTTYTGGMTITQVRPVKEKD